MPLWWLKEAVDSITIKDVQNSFLKAGFPPQISYACDIPVTTVSHWRFRLQYEPCTTGTCSRQGKASDGSSLFIIMHNAGEKKHGSPTSFGCSVLNVRVGSISTAFQKEDCTGLSFPRTQPGNASSAKNSAKEFCIIVHLFHWMNTGCFLMCFIECFSLPPPPKRIQCSAWLSPPPSIWDC